MEFVINMTMVTTVTALLLLLVKKVFTKVMTPKQQLAIWLVLLLQICIFPIGSAMDELGILPKSNLSIQNYVPSIGVSGCLFISVGGRHNYYDCGIGGRICTA